MGRLRELKQLGVRLAIDRFGAGFTSLRFLKRFPVDKLKIDASIMEHVTTDPDDGATVRAIIALGHSLDITITATGVSSDAQLAFLRAPGHNGQALAVDDEYQGFLCQQPLPAEQVAVWLQQVNKTPASGGISP